MLLPQPYGCIVGTSWVFSVARRKRPLYNAALDCGLTRSRRGRVISSYRKLPGRAAAVGAPCLLMAQDRTNEVLGGGHETMPNRHGRTIRRGARSRFRF